MRRMKFPLFYGASESLSKVEGDCQWPRPPGDALGAKGVK